MSIRAGLGLVFCCTMSSVSLGQAPMPAPTSTLAAAPPATHPGNSSPYRRMKFSERVLEPKLAKALGDHESTPYLYAPRSHAMLQVPTMEKIGQLRQLNAAEANKEYWMVFSNKGNLVRPGERVNVIIGKFHADGLLVE